MLDKCRCSIYKLGKGLKFIEFLCVYLKAAMNKKETCSIVFKFNVSQGGITALEYYKRKRITNKEFKAT